LFLIRLILVCFLNVRLHSLVVEVFYFSNITDIDLGLSDSVMVFNAKIVPVAMSFGIRVTSEETVVLVRLDSYS